MATVKINYRNILETGTVTVTNENNSFPSYRLYDRDIGKLFKGANNGSNNTFNIYVNQGNNVYEVDRLIIPSGHSLNGLGLNLSYSNDNNNYSDALTGWNANNAAIDKSFNAQNAQYWRFMITTAGNAPEIGELFLTKDYTFERNPRVGLSEERKRNIYRDETISGKMRKVKNGEEKVGVIYELSPMNSTQKSSLESWETGMDSIKSIFVRDHNGTLRFMEIMNDMAFINIASSLWSARLELMEVL